MTHMIETKQLTYAYPREEGEPLRYALNGVDLTIDAGSFVVVLGHNGSGKSTLAKHFNAVLLPMGGQVLVEGMDTADEALLLEIRRRVGMVFQNPDNQIVANVVEEDVAFGPWGWSPLPSTRLTCSPADRSSASPLPGSWLWSPGASCWTRPPPCWTPRAGGRCWTPSAA